eukprot:914281-Alexandrium_andersonii.AAC.1
MLRPVGLLGPRPHAAWASHSYPTACLEPYLLEPTTPSSAQTGQRTQGRHPRARPTPLRQGA